MTATTEAAGSAPAPVPLPRPGGGLRATMYRERLLLTSNRTNLLLALLPTAIYLVMFASSLSGLVGSVTYRGERVGYAEFTLPALMISSMLAAATATATSLFQEELGGMAVELWSYPLRRRDYVTGKLLATTALVAVQSVAALALGVVLYPVHWPLSHWLALAVAIAVASSALNAVYLLLATLVHDFQRFMVTINVLAPLLLFSSPSFYPAAQMPPLLRALSWANPVTYALGCVRDAALFGFSAIAGTAAGLLAGTAIVSALVVRTLTRRAASL